MARCPNCDAVVAIGCNCDVADENCFSWTGDGSEATPYVLEPVLSLDADQLLTCTSEGLSAVVPATLSNPPAVQAYHSVNVGIANNTLTTLNFNAELYDTDSMHSTVASTSRLTFTTAGVYIVTLLVAWNKHATGDRMAQVRKNGSDILGFESKRTGGADLIVGHSITVVEDFLAGDYVEARVQQTSGTTLLLLSESYSPFFSAARVA